MTIKGNRRLYILRISLRGYNGQCFDTPRLVRMILHSKLVLDYVKIKVIEHIARTTCKCAGFEGFEFI